MQEKVKGLFGKKVGQSTGEKVKEVKLSNIARGTKDEADVSLLKLPAIVKIAVNAHGISEGRLEEFKSRIGFKANAAPNSSMDGYEVNIGQGSYNHLDIHLFPNTPDGIQAASDLKQRAQDKQKFVPVFIGTDNHIPVVADPASVQGLKGSHVGVFGVSDINEKNVSRFMRDVIRQELAVEAQYKAPVVRGFGADNSLSAGPFSQFKYTVISGSARPGIIGADRDPAFNSQTTALCSASNVKLTAKTSEIDDLVKKGGLTEKALAAGSLAGALQYMGGSATEQSLKAKVMVAPTESVIVDKGNLVNYGVSLLIATVSPDLANIDNGYMAKNHEKEAIGATGLKFENKGELAKRTPLQMLTDTYYNAFMLAESESRNRQRAGQPPITTFVAPVIGGGIFAGQNTKEQIAKLTFSALDEVNTRLAKEGKTLSFEVVQAPYEVKLFSALSRAVQTKLGERAKAVDAIQQAVVQQPNAAELELQRLRAEVAALRQQGGLNNNNNAPTAPTAHAVDLYQQPPVAPYQAAYNPFAQQPQQNGNVNAYGGVQQPAAYANPFAPQPQTPGGYAANPANQPAGRGGRGGNF